MDDEPVGVGRIVEDDVSVLAAVGRESDVGVDVGDEFLRGASEDGSAVEEIELLAAGFAAREI